MSTLIALMMSFYIVAVLNTSLGQLSSTQTIDPLRRRPAVNLGQPTVDRGRADIDIDPAAAVALERLTSRQRRHLKREILAVLGLNHAPRPSGRTAKERAVEDFMLSLYQSTASDGDEGIKLPAGNSGSARVTLGNTAATSVDIQLDSVDTVISFTNQVIGPEAMVAANPTLRRCFFDLRAELRQQTSEQLTAAILRLYKFPAYGGVASSSANFNSSVVIDVYRVRHDVITDWRRSVAFETSVTVDRQFRGWINLNVTDAVTDWTRTATRNHGLIVRVSDLQTGAAVDPTTVGVVGDTGPTDKQLFLVAFFEKSASVASSMTSRQARARRSAAATSDDEVTSSSSTSSSSSGGRQQRGATSRPYSDEPIGWPYHNGADHRGKKCQRRNLYVSFRDLQWQDWIIAPEGYAAFYCDGECSFPLHAQMNATNHAIVQTLAHLMKPIEVPKPCCAPTKLSAISVLYFDDNSNVILKKYRNMVVRACGCH